MDYKISQYAKIQGVTPRTIWRWIKNGDIAIRKTKTGRVRVILDEIKEKNVAVYARVSSSEPRKTKRPTRFLL